MSGVPALIVVNVVVVLALVAGVVTLRRRVAALAAEPTIDATAPGGRASGETRSAEVIVIEITNHAAVASSRTLLARPVAALSPGLIRSIVNKETLRIMREQLADQGVVADVRLRRARLPVRRDVAPPDTADLDLDDWLHNDGDNPYDETD